jgi:ribosomal protein S18 acetylase RimI-like enzyme
MPGPPAIEVRRLGPADVAVLREMLGVFGEAFGDLATYVDAQPGDAYLAGLLASATFVAVAAFHDGRVVGGLAGYVLPKFEQARSELYIYDLAVLESQRRRGIATAMIEHARRVAAERNAYVIFVQADIGDEAAIGLYSKLGRREEVLHFDIDPASHEP